MGEVANPGPRGVLRFATQGDNQPDGELLDALERDLTPMVAPKRRAKRVVDEEEPARVADSSPRALHFTMRVVGHAQIPTTNH